MSLRRHGGPGRRTVSGEDAQGGALEAFRHRAVVRCGGWGWGGRNGRGGRGGAAGVGRTAQAVDQVRVSADTAGRRARAPAGAGRAKAAARILPGRCAVGLHGALGPAPLAASREVHARLHRDPVGARGQNGGRRQGDGETSADVGGRNTHGAEGLGAGQRASVVIEVDVDGWRGAGAIEVNTSNLDHVDRPGFAGGNYEIVGSLIVVSVERRLEVLRANAVDAGVVGLIVQDNVGATVAT